MKSLATIVCLVSCVIMTSSSMGGQFAYDYESFQRKYAGLEDVLGTRQQEYETERIGWAQAAGRREAAAAEETEKVYSNLMRGQIDPNAVTEACCHGSGHTRVK